MAELSWKIKRYLTNNGISTNQFARAAANQGVDIAVLINGIGRQGREVDDVFKELKDKGSVAFKPLEERKAGMREIRRKRLVANRGAAINQLAQKRVVSFRSISEKYQTRQSVNPSWRRQSTRWVQVRASVRIRWLQSWQTELPKADLIQWVRIKLTVKILTVFGNLIVLVLEKALDLVLSSFRTHGFK